MKKFGSITAIAIFIASLMNANAMADHRKGRIAAGLTLGVLGTALVVSELAHDHEHKRAHRHHNRAHKRAHRKHNRYHKRAHKIEYRYHRKQNRKYNSRAHQNHDHQGHRHGYNNRRKPFKQAYRELYGKQHNEQHQHPHRNMMRHYQHNHTEELNSEHVEWCNKTYDSYEQDTNTFKNNKGEKRKCNSPHS